MIVGVESDFVLELTFRQDEAADCTRILNLAEQSAILLAIPACALFEPYETLIRYSKKRDDVGRELKRELEQLARTDTYADLSEISKRIEPILSDSSKEQAVSLAMTIDRIVDIATVIPLDSEIIRRSRVAQRELDLPAQNFRRIRIDNSILRSAGERLQTVREQEQQGLRQKRGRRRAREAQLQVPRTV